VKNKYLSKYIKYQKIKKNVNYIFFLEFFYKEIWR
jgi:hypothetical protein